jgi:hypothetical protein
MNKSRGLKTRTPIRTGVKTELHAALKSMSDETKIPMSKLLDEAIDDLLVKRKPAKKQ